MLRRALATAVSALLLCSSSANAAATTPLEFVRAYVHQLASLEEAREQAEKDQTAKPGDFASCIRDNERIDLELGTSINLFNSMQLPKGGYGTDDVPHLVAGAYEQKRSNLRRFSEICAAFMKGPGRGVDFSALAAEAPKLTARNEYIDKSLFEGSSLVFATLISSRESSHKHADHLIITRIQRDDLLSEIETYFHNKMDQPNPNYAVATARLFRDVLKEYKCADDPWD